MSRMSSNQLQSGQWPRVLLSMRPRRVRRCSAVRRYSAQAGVALHRMLADASLARATLSLTLELIARS